MRLTELNAEFILRSMGDPTPIGVVMDCPCGCENRLYVPWADPDSIRQWGKTGDTLDTLTLTPSVQRTTGCPKQWHGFIRDGAAVPC